MGQARERTARVHVCTCSMCTGRARAAAGGRPKAARAACAAVGWPAHLRWWVGVPELEEVGDEVHRGMDRLARALVPRRVHVDVCAWVLCVRSGVCGGALCGVDLAWRLGGEGGTRAEIAPRTEA